MDRRALAEELGVGHHRHVGPAQHALDHLRGADGNGRLVHDDRSFFEVVADLGGRGLEVAEVGGAVLALGRGHAQVDELGVRHGHHGAQDEAQPTGTQTIGHEVLQTRFDDRDLTAIQPIDLVRYDVGTDDVVAEMRETGGGRQTRHSPYR